MHTVEPTAYGFIIRAEGRMDLAEAKAFKARHEVVLAEVINRAKPFGQIVDVRGFKVGGGPEAEAYLEKAMEAFKNAGGQRTAYILDNTIAAMQMKRLAMESNTYTNKRFIDVESTPLFEKVALAWVTEGKDPDKK